MRLPLPGRVWMLWVVLTKKGHAATWTVESWSVFAWKSSFLSDMSRAQQEKQMGRCATEKSLNATKSFSARRNVLEAVSGMCIVVLEKMAESNGGALEERVPWLQIMKVFHGEEPASSLKTMQKKETASSRTAAGVPLREVRLVENSFRTDD